MKISNQFVPQKWFFLLVLLTEGGALMAVELLGSKLVAPFYGDSLYVWSSVIAITIIGLTTGYYIGGILSVKHAEIKTLLFIVLVSSVLVFIMPYTSSLAIWFTSGINLRLGIILSCLFFLFPPVVAFGTIGPMTVKLLSQKTENIGRIAGSTYFLSTAGGILATFAFSFYLIPFAGIKSSILFISASLILLIPIYLIFYKRFRGKPIEAFTAKTTSSDPLNQKNKKVVVPDNNISKRMTYVFAMLEGISVMAIELIFVRMIAPYYGSTLFVWGSVIGITLISMASGYYIGGIVADKFTKSNTLYLILLLASFFILLMPFISKGLIVGLEDLEPVRAIIIISFLSITPPLLLLGMIPSLLIRFLTDKVERSGKSTGNVYAVSSVGGVICLFLMGYLIIPEFGLKIPLIVTGTLLGVIPLLRFVLKKKILALLFIVVVIIVFAKSQSKIRKTKDINVCYYSEGLLGQILVADVYKNNNINNNPLYDRVLFVNRMGQTFLPVNQETSWWNYINYISALSEKLPENSDALVLGLGGGLIENSLLKDFNFHFDAVELDERIVYVAREYFDLNKNVNVITDDARHYIETTNKKYDLIIFDIFKGENQPSHVFSLECFEKTKTLLKDSGFIIINFNGFLSGSVGKSGRSVFRTLEATGMDIKILPTYGEEQYRNCLFIAGNNKLDFSGAKIKVNEGIPVELNSLFINTNDAISEDAIILTDDKPNLDWLNMEANNIWRKGYTEIYTKTFTQKGIPLFK